MRIHSKFKFVVIIFAKHLKELLFHISNIFYLPWMDIRLFPEVNKESSDEILLKPLGC